jgi:hypothetical protein
MQNEKLQDWLQSEVTEYFFNQVKESLQLLKDQPRFRLYDKVGDTNIPMTSDMCALKNAYNEGRIEALDELIDSREAIIQLKKQNEEDGDED